MVMKLVGWSGPWSGSAIRYPSGLHISGCGVRPRNFRELFESIRALKLPLQASIVSVMNEAFMTLDAVVVGGGPAGLTAAIALAETGAKTALLARHAPYSDNRTTALLGASVDLLERLDVWRRCLDSAAPLKVMRLVDDTGRLIRAPEVRFVSDEIDLEQFGYNIDNRGLVAALEARAAELPGLKRVDD